MTIPVNPRQDTPKIGEIRKARETGHRGHSSYIWHACVDCGDERWVQVDRERRKKGDIVCRKCSIKRGELALTNSGARIGNRWSFKGGRHITLSGYVEVLIHSDSPFFSMASHSHYISEHRLIMAKHLNRCLLKSEQVHHINGIRTDNRLENLELLSKADHVNRTKFCNHCELKKEIRLLRWQIKEQSEQIKLLTSHLMGIE